MRRLNISGGRPLRGELKIQGSKNSVLPILAATLLTEEPCEIRNCPDLTDVRAALEILEALGCRVSFDGQIARVDAGSAAGTKIPDELMRRMRSSVMFLGAILGRNRSAQIGHPGGCELGARPIDIHLRAFSRLGVSLLENGGYIHCHLRQYLPQTITLIFPSVGATENVMMLCALMPGETVLVNPAREPEIVDLQNFLNCMGADVMGAGSDCIRIRGVKKLHGCSYSVIPDRIVAATYACSAVSCGGEVLLSHVEPEHMRLFLAMLQDMGAQIREEGDRLWVKAKGRPNAIPLVKTLPYPGFPTDMQPLLMAALLKSRGSTVFHETIFENRFRHAGEFLRLGGDVQVEGVSAIVHGVNRLHGADVYASDLRGGAGLILAALGADGKTRIEGVEHIERGYVSVTECFRKLGGDVILTED
ncbi:MAG: UDP-N-acetylglucosamine 1-carboxyvinyltransferase [Clostridia bacterium]|nr:UDP-N-acetylglucosamine 1-carboxyvinyltransferase [Clostridia bacterium]